MDQESAGGRHNWMYDWIFQWATACLKWLYRLTYRRIVGFMKRWTDGGTNKRCVNEYFNVRNHARRDVGRYSYIPTVLVVKCDCTNMESWRTVTILVDAVLAPRPVNVRFHVGKRPRLYTVLRVDVPLWKEKLLFMRSHSQESLHALEWTGIPGEDHVITWRKGKQKETGSTREIQRKGRTIERARAAGRKTGRHQSMVGRKQKESKEGGRQ